MKKILKIIGIVVLAAITVFAINAYRVMKGHGFLTPDVYEVTAPQLPGFTRPAVLVLNKTNGFIHKEAIPAADAMLKRITEENGWDIYITDNAATHNFDVLDKFDLVVWNNVSGDVLTDEQRASFKQWLSNGGGWVGFHGTGGDSEYQWRWYVDTLIGAQFVGHTMNPQFQDADVLVTDKTLALTSHLSTPWRIAQEEWYAFDQNPRDKGYEIVLTIDESSYITKGETRVGNDHMEGEHPLAWHHRIGDGKVFYSSIGHQAATYSLPEFQQLMANAMAWAMAEGSTAEVTQL